MECSEPLEKNLVNRTIFDWVTALWKSWEGTREISLELDQIIKPNKIEYADDVGFVRTKNYIDLDKITLTMKKYKLIINKDKTEYVKIKRDTDRKKNWRE